MEGRSRPGIRRKKLNENSNVSVFCLALSVHFFWPSLVPSMKVNKPGLSACSLGWTLTHMLGLTKQHDLVTMVEDKALDAP